MIPLESLRFHGRDLARPECVLCTSDGRVHVADWRGGVTVLEPDGSERSVLATDREVRPNGIALMPDRSYLLADLGRGGVHRLHGDGRLEPFCLEVAGQRLPPTNFVHLDREGRIWITVSTRLEPRHLACRADVADGFVVLVDGGRTRIAADGLGYANECVVHDGHLYVNETFARRTSRFRLRPGGGLGPRETVATYGPGTFPDGLTFDAQGGIWITSVVSNRVIRVAPSGQQEIVLEDSDPTHVTGVEDAYRTGTMGRAHLDRIESCVLRNISSLAFGEAGLRRAYLGCLLDRRIASFEAPVPGLAPVHWDFPSP